MSKSVLIRELNKYNSVFFRNSNLKKPATKFDLMLYRSKGGIMGDKRLITATTEHLQINIRKGWNHLMFSDDGSITLY